MKARDFDPFDLEVARSMRIVNWDLENLIPYEQAYDSCTLNNSPAKSIRLKRWHRRKRDVRQERIKWIVSIIGQQEGNAGVA